MPGRPEHQQRHPEGLHGELDGAQRQRRGHHEVRVRVFLRVFRGRHLRSHDDERAGGSPQCGQQPALLRRAGAGVERGLERLVAGDNGKRAAGDRAGRSGGADGDADRWAARRPAWTCRGPRRRTTAAADIDDYDLEYRVKTPQGTTQSHDPSGTATSTTIAEPPGQHHLPGAGAGGERRGRRQLFALGRGGAPPPPQTTPPEFTEGATTTRSVDENSASGESVGTPVAASDADNDNLTYTPGRGGRECLHHRRHHRPAGDDDRCHLQLRERPELCRDGHRLGRQRRHRQHRASRSI